MVDFQQQSPQRLVDIYKHVNSQNDRLDLRLNPFIHFDFLAYNGL